MTEFNLKDDDNIKISLNLLKRQLNFLLTLFSFKWAKTSLTMLHFHINFKLLTSEELPIISLVELIEFMYSFRAASFRYQVFSCSTYSASRLF